MIRRSRRGAPERGTGEADPAGPQRRHATGSSPDVAYFHSLLQGGIERAEIYEAFPGFRFVIEEAIGQHEAASAPILSDAPTGPSRQDLNDEIRGIRQELQATRKPERRRWRGATDGRPALSRRQRGAPE